ncbi:NAD(P)-dependent oxidoreductase [[Flexibacter] sp. ATCC 35208]|uniref:NAD(P)-dependent oxidoreductase n=1 Tax=[Flexibacter] sp. ATCC 35208 TaxID=1936242 RepID=UPI0009D1EC33|nr:NAD(P)-dependent oxidoreductase [[Flexibacter] sp. ATCC 35208]OMP78987.1 pyridine nucleotide-disulfide oxidoreductase [[Flexibacter] sp. ATCC 35208]
MSLRNNRLTTEEYNAHFSDIHPPFEIHSAALVEANRCLFCYDAPCTKSCPTSIDVPKFIKQITTENLKGAAYTILSANIMGGGCSKVCPVEKLCEGACVYNLLEEEAIPIAKLQRYATERAIREKWPLFTRQPSNGKRVAVIGAGPAGLSCAHALSREGVDVTIYEKESKGGGLMTYGIAAYKVTPQFCQEEVDYIISLGGINVLYNMQLGKDVLLEILQQQYDAVYLAYGVGLARQLSIAGEQLNGVVDAIHFIYEIRTKGYPEVPVGESVAVIGMGMTAIDAATQAKRLGAKDVTLVYRRTEAEMPCTETELNIAKLDGCKIIWLAAPKEITGENGQVKQLVCEMMRLDERKSPVGTGELITLNVDMVIKATGQLPYTMASPQIDNDHGKVLINEHAATSLPGVFAGGDCVNGGKEVVDAVQAGKEGAKAILQYLIGE